MLLQIEEVFVISHFVSLSFCKKITNKEKKKEDTNDILQTCKYKTIYLQLILQCV